MGPIDYGTFAHELGHLLGLGDDYAEAGLVPGRGSGLMARDLEITQDYVDRIAKLLEELDRLPECWSGTMRAIGDPETRTTGLDHGGDLHFSRNNIEFQCSDQSFR